MDNPTVAIFPPRIIDLGVKQVIFLAGPIQGAPNWQADAISYFIHNSQGLWIACPRDMKEWHGDYSGQVDWETHHLRRAAITGMILFWLAKEETHTCERAYAQTSRFELGEWIGGIPCRSRPAIALGIEEGFTNERYIRRRVGQDHPNLPIHDNLLDTCEYALQNMPPF